MKLVQSNEGNCTNNLDNVFFQFNKYDLLMAHAWHTVTFVSKSFRVDFTAQIEIASQL